MLSFAAFSVGLDDSNCCFTCCQSSVCAFPDTTHALAKTANCHANIGVRFTDTPSAGVRTRICRPGLKHFGAMRLRRDCGARESEARDREWRRTGARSRRGVAAAEARLRL